MAGLPPRRLAALQGTPQEDFCHSRPCGFLHAGHSCNDNSLHFFPRAYARALPVYLPVYLLPAILVHRKRLLDGKAGPQILGKVRQHAGNIAIFYRCTCARLFLCGQCFHVSERNNTLQQHAGHCMMAVAAPGLHCISPARQVMALALSITRASPRHCSMHLAVSTILLQHKCVDGWYILVQVATGAARSSLFLALYCAFAWRGACAGFQLTNSITSTVLAATCWTGAAPCCNCHQPFSKQQACIWSQSHCRPLMGHAVSLGPCICSSVHLPVGLVTLAAALEMNGRCTEMVCETGQSSAADACCMCF